MSTDDTNPPRRGRDLAVVDPHRSDRGRTAAGLRLGITHYDPPPPDRGHGLGGAAARPTASASPTSSGLRSPSTEGGGSSTAGTRAAGSWGRPWCNLGPSSTVSRPSNCPTSSTSPSAATAGCASSRPAAAAPVCPHRGGSGVSPFVQWQAPLVWTTLSLTLHADGRTEYALIGASRFPRHWVYDADEHARRTSPG